MNKQVFTVLNGSYPFDIVVAVGLEYDEVYKYIEKTKGYKLDKEEKEKIMMDGIGRTVMLDSGAMVLRVVNLQDRAKFHANLSHEIFHAVEFMLCKIGLVHHRDFSGEAYAYQIAYLTMKIYEKLYKK